MGARSGLAASILLEKFLWWQFAEVCEVANTDLSDVFQFCSRTAFSLASPPMSLKPSPVSQPLPAVRNESTRDSQASAGADAPHAFVGDAGL